MKKKVFLVSPSERGILSNAGDRPPLGIAYMGAHLRENGVDVRLYDMNHERTSNLIQDVDAEKPDHIGISVFTSPLYQRSIDLANMLKKVHNTNLVAGGYHASVMPSSVEPEFDQVIMGEGEYAMLDIVKGNRLPRIDGKPANLDILPLPARDMLPMEKYNMQQNGKRTATLMSSRGCPYGCSFCGNLPHNKKVRFKPVEKVDQEITNLMNIHGYHNFYFYDELFTSNKDRVKKLTDKIKPHGITYRITTRADKVDKDIANWLVDSGCNIVSFGIESGNNDVLRKSRKGMTVDQNRKAVKLFGERGVDVKGFFVIGMPGETYETAKQTVDFARELKDYGMKSADFYPLIPFPGSPISKNARGFGIKILDKDWKNYLQASVHGGKAISETKDLKASQIEEIIKGAEKEWKK